MQINTLVPQYMNEALYTNSCKYHMRELVNLISVLKLSANYQEINHPRHLNDKLLST